MPLQPIHVAVPTAFNADESLNLEATLNHVRNLIERGVQSIMFCGSTGEQHSLDLNEKFALIDAIEAANLPKNVEILFGVAAVRQTQAVALAEKIAKSPAISAILLGFPPYIRPTQSQAIAYAEAIMQATQKPTVIYNNPERTGFDLAAESAIALAKNPNVAGFKDPSEIAKLQANIDRPLRYFIGGDEGIAEKIQQGYNGLSSQLANLYPEQVQAYVQALLANQTPVDDITPLVADFYQGSFVVLLKQQLGLGVGRSPLV